ncbi:formyl transferase [Ochrobactrum sp. XJ1]|nr:formyl transferase [Ochrobactrum sp. XJ1]
MSKITVLCSDGPHHFFLIDQILENFGSVEAVIEPSNLVVRKLLRERKWRQLAWTLYHQFRRSAFGYAKYRKTFFETTTQLNIDKIRDSAKCRSLITQSVNDDEVEKFIASSTSNLFIVMGTSKISRKILDRIPQEKIINIHGGHLPDYKGNHCFFFALYNEDYDKLSTTIHRVTPNLDAGEIIQQYTVKYLPGDTSEYLYCRAEKMAILDLVRRIKNHPALEHWPSVPQEKTGTTYRMRDRHPLVELKYHARKLLITSRGAGRNGQ